MLNFDVETLVSYSDEVCRSCTGGRILQTQNWQSALIIGQIFKFMFVILLSGFLQILDSSSKKIYRLLLEFLKLVSLELLKVASNNCLEIGNSREFI